MGLNQIIELYNLGRNKENLSVIDKLDDPGIEILAIKSLVLTLIGRTREANNLAIKLHEDITGSDPITKYIVLCAEIRSIATSI